MPTMADVRDSGPLLFGIGGAENTGMIGEVVFGVLLLVAAVIVAYLLCAPWRQEKR